MLVTAALLACGASRAATVPRPVNALPSAPPRILYVHFSATVVRVGSWWSGRVVTTTNVASLEFRAPSFSFVLHRAAYGEFAFDTHVLVVPSIYRRAFVATLVARTASGASEREEFHLAFE